MKTAHIIKPISIFTTLSFFVGISVHAQNEDALKAIVDSKKFVFVAEYAMPMNGNNVSLNSDQTVIVSTDSIIANLPYYGTAYQAQMGSDQTDISFTSVKFKYASAPSKKDGWDISITPRDISSSQKFSLHISSTGKARLEVTSNERQPISFTGYIKGK